MIVQFSEHFRLPVGDVYSYFKTPADWTRLYGLAGEPKSLEDDWFAIGLKGFPFPLVAKNVVQIPNEMVRWVFRGFWRGEGEIRFVETANGVMVEGYEKIGIRWLLFLSPVIERLFLDRRFRAIWAIGWRRLRQREAPEA